MTRDEAINIVGVLFNRPTHLRAEDLVDVYVKLGLLKLEEPSSHDKLHGLLREREWTGRDIDEFSACLKQAGLKIVEAGKLCWDPIDHDRSDLAKAQRAEAGK